MRETILKIMRQYPSYPVNYFRNALWYKQYVIARISAELKSLPQRIPSFAKWQKVPSVGTLFCIATQMAELNCGQKKALLSITGHHYKNTPQSHRETSARPGVGEGGVGEVVEVVREEVLEGVVVRW
jgi:hypothetical protein